MAESDLSPALIQFIHGMLPSYEATVVLVHVWRQPGRAWSVEELVTQIGPAAIDVQAARHHLEQFVRAGLLQERAPSEYGLGPRWEELQTVLEELRVAYDERPVTLIRALDSAARARIQAFADAFRLKRD